MITWSEGVDIDLPTDRVLPALGGRVVEPEIDFRVEPVRQDRTRVWLDFRIEPPVPRPLTPLARLFLRRRIRPLRSVRSELLEREPLSGAA